MTLAKSQHLISHSRKLTCPLKNIFFVTSSHQAAVRLPMKTDKEKADAAIVKLFTTCKSLSGDMNWTVPIKFVKNEANVCYYEATIQRALMDNNITEQAEAFLFGISRMMLDHNSWTHQSRRRAHFVGRPKIVVSIGSISAK